MFGGKQALDSEKLLSAINDYKKIFPVRKADEKYKWQAVKHFQDKWNIDAPDFRQMFEQATKLCGNLLASYNFYPRGMMCEIARQDSEFARSLFKELFDESKDLAARVDKFDKQAKEFCKIHFPGKQSYQNANAISTYLWLRYPDKYYIYKYTEAKQVEKKLCNESFLTGKKGAYRLAAAFEKYDLIRNALSADKEYTAMLKEFLTPDCYQDENFCTATIDFVYLLDKSFAHDPWEYTAVISKEDAEKYTYEDFAADRVFISDEQLKDLTALMASKRNIILQGAPGVGKTYIAKRLAWLKMGEKDNSRIRTVQFHQNYSYEDFVIGYKPNGDKFELTCGIFYNFCKMAEGEPNKKFFFIIDEINRGNLSKIFGELLMLIEETHRGEKIVLSQNGAEFCVPKNLYIIGMMNTADRSLAIIDYALRRRFAFFDMRPGFDCKAFKEYCSSLANPLFDKLISGIKSLNEAIEKDDALGEGFCIGHSYFSCLEGEDIKSRLHIVVKYEILPMLKEYWFDDRQKYLDWESTLTKILEE